MPEAPDSPRGPQPLLAILAMLVVGALCYAVGVDGTELDKEEARRVLPAREMVASGDYVVPTIWQRTYLAKPPMMFWTIAAAGEVHGELDEVATRVPSVLATILTALLLFWFGSAVFGRRTGTTAGLLWLVSLGVFEKGALGELEAGLAFYVFAATATMWRALDDGATKPTRHTCTVLSCVALAAATMTKGPVALLFFGAALVGAAVSRRNARLLLRTACWLPIVIAIAVIGTWVAMVVARVDSEHALGVWAGEIARAKDFGWANYFDDRLDMIGGVLAAFFPGSWLCLCAWFARRRESVAGASNPAVRFLAISIVASLAFFLVQPGVRTRFCYPALPWCALLAAYLLTRSLAVEGSKNGAIRMVALLVGAAGILVAIAAQFALIDDIPLLEPFSQLLLIPIAGLSIFVLYRLRRAPNTALLLAMVATLTCLRLLQTTVLAEVSAALPQKQTFGERVDDLVPPGQAIDLRFWFAFNELSYVTRTLVHAELQDPIGKHRFVLAIADDVAGLRANSERELVERGALQLVKGTEVRLLEVR